MVYTITDALEHNDFFTYLFASQERDRSRLSESSLLFLREHLGADCTSALSRACSSLGTDLQSFRLSFYGVDGRVRRERAV